MTSARNSPAQDTDTQILLVGEMKAPRSLWHLKGPKPELSFFHRPNVFPVSCEHCYYDIQSPRLSGEQWHMWVLAMERRSSENSTRNSGRATEVTAGEHESPGCTELKKFRAEGT